MLNQFLQFGYPNMFLVCIFSVMLTKEIRFRLYEILKMLLLTYLHLVLQIKKRIKNKRTKLSQTKAFNRLITFGKKPIEAKVDQKFTFKIFILNLMYFFSLVKNLTFGKKKKITFKIFLFFGQKFNVFLCLHYCINYNVWILLYFQKN